MFAIHPMIWIVLIIFILYVPQIFVNNVWIFLQYRNNFCQFWNLIFFLPIFIVSSFTQSIWLIIGAYVSTSLHYYDIYIDYMLFNFHYWPLTFFFSPGGPSQRQAWPMLMLMPYLVFYDEYVKMKKHPTTYEFFILLILFLITSLSCMMSQFSYGLFIVIFFKWYKWYLSKFLILFIFWTFLSLKGQGQGSGHVLQVHIIVMYVYPNF